MEQVTTVALTQQSIDPNESLTLAQARERMRTLLSHCESNAWDIGDLLNTVEKRGLARSEGYGKTRKWLEAEVPEADGKTAALYRYANIASHYAKEHVELWGVSKLDRLAIHDRETLGHVVSGDPGEREVQLLQEDGSTVAKKFRDCTFRELCLSAQRRKRGPKGPNQATTPAPQSEVHSLRHSWAVLGMGILVTVVSGLLPSSFLTTWVFLLGAGLFLSGIAMLIRRWEIARDRLLSAFKEGKAIDLMAEQVAKARRGALKLTAMIRSRRNKRLTTASKEATPPVEKKAA
jgi:hypothetical protein